MEKIVTAFFTFWFVFKGKMKRSTAFPKEKPAAGGCGSAPAKNITVARVLVLKTNSA